MSKMDMMSDWLTGEAKKQFYEVLRQSETEPQQIFRHNRMVAAVISATTFEEFELWRESRQRRTLGAAFDEVGSCLCVTTTSWIPRSGSTALCTDRTRRRGEDAQADRRQRPRVPETRSTARSSCYTGVGGS